MPDSGAPMLSTAEACELLEIDRGTLLRWVASGKAEAALKLPGQTGAYVFQAAEIARLMTARALAG